MDRWYFLKEREGRELGAPMPYSWNRGWSPGPPGKKPDLLFFAGSTRMGDPQYSGGARQKIFEIFGDSGGTGGARNKKLRDPDIKFFDKDVARNYLRLLTNSTFCLNVYGHGFGQRLSHYMFFGCIPVTIQDHVIQASTLHKVVAFSYVSSCKNVNLALPSILHPPCLIIRPHPSFFLFLTPWPHHESSHQSFVFVHLPVFDAPSIPHTLFIKQPFEDLLRYPDFSLRLSNDDIPRLGDILRGVGGEEVQAMQQRLYRNHRYFIWRWVKFQCRLLPMIGSLGASKLYKIL